MYSVNPHIGPGESGYPPTTQRPEFEPLLRDPEWFVRQAGEAMLYATLSRLEKVCSQLRREFRTEWLGYYYDETFDEYEKNLLQTQKQTIGSKKN